MRKELFYNFKINKIFNSKPKLKMQGSIKQDAFGKSYKPTDIGYSSSYKDVKSDSFGKTYGHKDVGYS
jgi:hypothetical protein